MKILCCPFCGLDNVSVSKGLAVEFLLVKKNFFVFCSDCDSRGPSENTERYAIQGWNDVSKLAR